MGIYSSAAAIGEIKSVGDDHQEVEPAEVQYLLSVGSVGIYWNKKSTGLHLHSYGDTTLKQGVYKNRTNLKNHITDMLPSACFIRMVHSRPMSYRKAPLFLYSELFLFQLSVSFNWIAQNSS